MALPAALKAVFEGVNLEEVPVKNGGHVNGSWLKPGGDQGYQITDMRFTVEGDTLIGTARCGDQIKLSIPHFRAMLDRLAPSPTTNGNRSPRKST